MRAVVWITDRSWRIAADLAATLPADAELLLLAVVATGPEALAGGPGAPHLLGRHRKPPPGPPPEQISEDEARALLDDAAARIGREARREIRHGRVEDEVVLAAAGADVLVVARDGRPGAGPPSFGPRARFVVDHAPCAVLLGPPAPGAGGGGPVPGRGRRRKGGGLPG